MRFDLLFTPELRLTYAEKCRTLRRLIDADDPLLLPLIYDAVSAQMFERAGWPVMYLSGGFLSSAALGLADVGLINQFETVTRARYVANAINSPLVVDADSGYGNVLNSLRTAHDLFQAGAAAIQVEDQILPKRSGTMGGKELVSMQEASAKLAAICKLRDEIAPGAVVIARCDAFNAPNGGIDELIRRCVAYREAGADVIFPEALRNEQDIARVLSEVGKPILYNMVAGNLIPIEQLKALGVSIALHGEALFCTMRALWDYAHALKKDPDGVEQSFREAGVGHPVGTIPAFLDFFQLQSIARLNSSLQLHKFEEET